MNSLNTLGTRQVASLNTDLAKLESGESGPGVQGEFNIRAGRAVVRNLPAVIPVRLGTGKLTPRPNHNDVGLSQSADRRLRLDGSERDGHGSSREGPDVSWSELRSVHS